MTGIDKDTFRKTEGMLYRFFKQQKELRRLECICTHLEVQKERIRIDLRETNVDIEEESKSITYEERVQTSSSCGSYAEKELIRQITKLENEWKYVRKKLLKNKARMREVERQITPMKVNIDMLSKEAKEFVELKYGDGKSVNWIGDFKYGGARTTAHRRREEIINDIAHWSNLIR